jgi:hypothetical protein
MKDMKPADISGIQRGTSERQKIELATNSKDKNIRDMYRGIN